MGSGDTMIGSEEFFPACFLTMTARIFAPYFFWSMSNTVKMMVPKYSLNTESLMVFNIGSIFVVIDFALSEDTTR